MIQHVVFNEQLPLILGTDVMRRYGLELERDGFYHGTSTIYLRFLSATHHFISLYLAVADFALPCFYFTLLYLILASSVRLAMVGSMCTNTCHAILIRYTDTMPILVHNILIQAMPILIHNILIQAMPILIHTILIQTMPILIHTILIQTMPILIQTILIQAVPILIHTILIQAMPILIHNILIQAVPILIQTILIQPCQY